METKLIVMQKDGKSYVKLSEYASSYIPPYVINGKDAVLAPGDKRYAIVEGEVASIERKVTPSRNIVGYVLYERYKTVTQLPHEMPADAFWRNDDGDLCGENAEFYHAVYDDPQPYLEPVGFDIIDRDCEPVKIPSYVTIEFPHNIARYPETQHKYPCYIASKQVFELLYDSVKERVDASDGKYTMDSYRNIQALRVEERITIPYNETKTQSYYPTARSRKPKTRTIQVRWKNVKVIEIYGPEYSSSNPIKRVQAVKGENYADLQTKLESYIQTFLAELTDGKREVCGHCRGEGVVCV